MMKHRNIKCTRQQSQLLIRSVCLMTGMLFVVLSVHAQTDVRLPAIGGGGGSEFVARCPEGKLLVGFVLQAGDWVDAISPVCVADYGLYRTGQIDEPSPKKFGGDGGRVLFGPFCSNHTDTLVVDNYDLLGHKHTSLALSLAPIVLGMYVGSEGKHTVTVNRIHLICGIADPDKIDARDLSGDFLSVGLSANAEILDAAIKAQLKTNQIRPPTVSFDGITHYQGPEGEQRCPDGLVAVGIHGRSGEWLDAVGLICGAPIITSLPSGKSSPPPVALGRVPSTSPPGPPMSICARARDARARNSPVAPALEAQCRVYLKNTVLAKPQDPIRIKNGALVFGKPDVNAPAVKGPTITADANPVAIPNGQTSGTTTITWKAAPDYTYSEIYLSVDNGEWSEFARGGDGSKSTTIKLGSSYTFYMMVYEGQAGTPKVITTLTLTAKN